MKDAGTTASSRWVRHQRSALVVAAVGAVIATVCSLIAASGRVGSVERAVFEAVNGLPNALEWPMWLLQLGGLMLTPLAVALVALALRRWRLAIAAVALIPVKLIVEHLVIKELVDRQRPGVTELDPILRGVPESGQSFPSGHAIIAFALATLLTPYVAGRWLLLIWTLATLNGVARIYLGAHNPLDVVAGAGAGMFIGGVLTLVLGISDPTVRAPRHDRPGQLPGT